MDYGIPIPKYSRGTKWESERERDGAFAFLLFLRFCASLLLLLLPLLLLLLLRDVRSVESRIRL